MKKHCISYILMSLFILGCSTDDDTKYGNWVKSSTFDGDSRGNAVSFTIGTKGYLISGYDGDDYLADTWEFDSEGKYWVKKADFPGTARSGAVGFSINGKGYIGTGYDGDDELKDFWEYNPDTNEWSQKSDFGGTARYGAIGFSLNGKGYIGTGYDGSEQKDFWRYDPTSNNGKGSWEQVLGFVGEKRQKGSVFVINDIAYISLGKQNGVNVTDFYSFDGTNWTMLNNLKDYNSNDDDIYLDSCVGFTINGKGYFATGGTSGSITKNCWVYEPSNDTWKTVSSFQGSARQDASAFTFANTAYVLMGRSGSYYFDDIWEFRPSEKVNDDD